MKTEPREAYIMIEEDWYAIPYMGTDYPQDPDIVVDKKDVYEIAKKAFEEGQSSPKINKLEWRYDEEFFIWEANSVFGKYFVKAGKNEGALTVDANKAAAQADFEKKIKECLE